MSSSWIYIAWGHFGEYKRLHPMQDLPVNCSICGFVVSIVFASARSRLKISALKNKKKNKKLIKLSLKIKENLKIK